MRLGQYLVSLKSRDPAARSRLELLLYPGVWAMAIHRIAYFLYQRHFYVSSRIINHFARFMTAIDIHPGANIGKALFIDHGFVVIGETSVIGDNVTLYGGVTLGGTNPTTSASVKRHPTLLNDVVVGSGAQILGPITIGNGAKVGANAVVTKDVSDGETVGGIPAIPLKQSGPPDCDADDPIDFLRIQLDELRDELENLRSQSSYSGHSEDVENSSSRRNGT